MLLELGRVEEAKKAAVKAIEREGCTPELCFCAANVVHQSYGRLRSERDRLRLLWINRPFVASGLASIELKDESKPLTMDNIAAPSARSDPKSSKAKVSVLMPARNAERTIHTAIESVLRQTWTNLELIVVDDSSDDETWGIIKAFAAKDSRVRPMQQDQQRGAYAARNAALQCATGDLITVLDADDWSHPERLARQATDMLNTDNFANATMVVRTDPFLRIL